MNNDDTENNNVRQFSLNLVSPSDKDRDTELRDCLDKGLADLNKLIKEDTTKSFFTIILGEGDDLIFIGAGEAQPLRTLGALRNAEHALLKEY